MASKKRAQADHYTIRAKKEGYPARSVYKLEEIEEKIGILNPDLAVLDIGAAPGSWSLFISRWIKKKGKAPRIVAVDLKEMGAPKKSGITCITGDAFAPGIRRELEELGPFGTVVSDAAPATTGNRLVDTGRSTALVESVMELAQSILEPGGNLVVKLFQGGDEQQLLARMKEQYQSARMLKPKACRKDSFETYLIGMGKKSGAVE
jgi:23S rRNA (uridine2552-2'-O)-methyltransferase